METFIITYTVDTGHDYIKDTAIVKANNRIEAERALRSYIGHIGNEYCLCSIYSIEVFNGSIFTAKFKHNGGQ